VACPLRWRGLLPLALASRLRSPPSWLRTPAVSAAHDGACRKHAGWAADETCAADRPGQSPQIEADPPRWRSAACSTTMQQQVAVPLEVGVIAWQDASGHLVEPPPAHRAPGTVWVCSSPRGIPLAGSRKPCPNGDHYGQGLRWDRPHGPGPRLHGAQRRRSKPGQPRMRSPSWIRCSQLLASSPPAHSARSRALARATGARPASSSWAAAPEKKTAAPCRPRASNGQVGQAPSRASSRRLWESLSGAKPLAVGPPGQPQGSNDGWLWSGCRDRGRAAAAHRMLEPCRAHPAGPRPGRPQQPQRARAQQPGGGGRRLTAMAHRCIGGVPVTSGGIQAPNESRAD